MCKVKMKRKHILFFVFAFLLLLGAGICIHQICFAVSMKKCTIHFSSMEQTELDSERNFYGNVPYISKEGFSCSGFPTAAAEDYCTIGILLHIRNAGIFPVRVPDIWLDATGYADRICSYSPAPIVAFIPRYSSNEVYCCQVTYYKGTMSQEEILREISQWKVEILYDNTWGQKHKVLKLSDLDLIVR